MQNNEKRKQHNPWIPDAATILFIQLNMVRGWKDPEGAAIAAWNYIYKIQNPGKFWLLL